MNARFRLPAILAFPLAALLAVAALGGIALPAVYAQEHPHWSAQGYGQDWVDLVLVSPLLALVARLVLKGSRRAALLLAGLLAYALYSMVLYAFFMHFGPLFLVYTAALGLAFYALVALVSAFTAEDMPAWFGPGAPVRLAGALSVILGGAYGVMWLAEVVPALARGTGLASAAGSGLITNPVQVLDFGIVLPAFVIGGVALARRRPLGYWLAPTMLGFAVVMDAALVGMSVSVRARTWGEGPPLAFLVTSAVVTAAVLALLLRRAPQAGREAGRSGTGPAPGGEFDERLPDSGVRIEARDEV